LKNYPNVVFLCVVFLFCSLALSQEQRSPAWFSVRLGLGGVDLELGTYDLFAERVHGRAFFGFPFSSIGADVLYMPEDTTGFYLAGGVRLRIPSVGVGTRLGPNVSLGYDIELARHHALYLRVGAGLLFSISQPEVVGKDGTTQKTNTPAMLAPEIGFGYSYKF
jgi:hypothetical protein